MNHILRRLTRLTARPSSAAATQASSVYGPGHSWIAPFSIYGMPKSSATQAVNCQHITRGPFSARLSLQAHVGQ